MFFNRFNRGGIDIFTPALNGILEEFGYSFEGNIPIEPIIDKAVSCYLDPSQCPENNEGFLTILGIVEAEYENYIAGLPDPTSGALFFVHLSTTNTVSGFTFDSIEEVVTYVDTWSSQLAVEYTPEMANSQGQIYPFTYGISVPYSYYGVDIVLYMGNHVCVSAVSCGSNWATVME